MGWGCRGWRGGERAVPAGTPTLPRANGSQPGFRGKGTGELPSLECTGAVGGRGSVQEGSLPKRRHVQ